MNPSTTTASKRSPPSTLINLHSSNWLSHSTLFTNPHVRGFISESGVVFKFVQRIAHNREPLSTGELLKSSRKYRSVIHSWFIKMVTMLRDESEPAKSSLRTERERHEIDQLAKMLHRIEIAWHLCEILLMDIRGPGQQAAQLLNWTKWHFTDIVELAEQVIVADLPQMHEYYWDVIHFFALRGDMENASLFLELHTECSAGDSAFQLIRELLKKYPPLNAGTTAMHDYYIRFQLWRESVSQAIAERKITPSGKRSHIQLNLLLHLLAGDLEAFRSVTHLFGSWYQMMISFMLFTDPCLKEGKFFEIWSDKFIDIFSSSDEIGRQAGAKIEIDPFDELIRCTFLYQLPDLISRLSICFDDNWWFVTHFVDLLYNSAHMRDYQLVDIPQLRDSFVPDYADALLSRRKQFWQLAIEYLQHCANSRDHILLALERIVPHCSNSNRPPQDDQRRLQTLISLAKRFGFNEFEQSLYKIETRRWLQKSSNDTNHYGSALFWAIRSKDKMLINAIVDRYLRHYLRTAAEAMTRSTSANSADPAKTISASEGEILDADMIANIGGAIVLSERLIFLCKYYEFHQLRKSGSHQPAAKILIDMIASNAIPQFFAFQVVLDCLPLLESPQVVISGEQTCKILASLETIIDKLNDEDDPADRSRHSIFCLQSRSIGGHNNSNNANNNNSYDHPNRKKNNGIDDADERELAAIRAHQRGIMKRCENVLRFAIARNLSRNFVLPLA